MRSGVVGSGYLQNFAVLSFVLLTFGVSNTLADESGLLAVTVTGIWLANMREVETSDIVEFKEELSAILLSALFIIWRPVLISMHSGRWAGRC